MTDKEKIQRLEEDLKIAKFRLAGGPDGTNQPVDLTPTVDEFIHFVVPHYWRALERLSD